MKLDLSKLKYVLLDWDNTLAETRTALVTVINQVLEEYNRPPMEECRNYDKNLSFRDNFPNIFGAELAVEAYERYAVLYKEKVASLLSTFPDVKETLDFFAGRAIPMIVMTNKDRRLLEFEMPLLFSPQIFERIVAGHEAPRDKPYPEQAWYALSGLLDKKDFSPEKVWIIGDSDMDSDCALSADAQAIRIGKPIWNDGISRNEKIIYFADFTAFLKYLKTIA